MHAKYFVRVDMPSNHYNFREEGGGGGEFDISFLMIKSNSFVE